MRRLGLGNKKPKPWDNIKRVTLARTLFDRYWDNRFVKVRKDTFLRMIKKLNTYERQGYRVPIMLSAEGDLMHPPRQVVCKLKSCSKSFLTGHNNTKYHSAKCRQRYWNLRTAAEHRALRLLGRKMQEEGRTLDIRSEEVIEHMERVARIVEETI